MAAWQEVAGGIDIAIRVTPRSGRAELAAGTPEHFTARITAAPVDGAANSALVKLVAEVFHVAPRDVELIGGGKSRLKRLRILGNTEALARVAAALYGTEP